MSERSDDESYGELARRLMADGESFAKARVTLYRELAIYRATQLRAPAILFIVALVLGACSILAVILGLVLALSPLVGGLLAGLIVAVAALAIAGLLALIGRNKLKALGDDPLADADLLETGDRVTR